MRPSTELDATVTTGSLFAGRFRILRKIASSGMGEVHEAERLDVGGRCALKLLLPSHVNNPRVVEYFT